MSAGPGKPAGEAEFYVGYLPRPGPATLRFAGLAALVVIALAGALALALGALVGDPGDGGYGDEVALTGTVEMTPYPLLRLPPDATGRGGGAVMLTGDGKFGVAPRAAELAGGGVTAKGFIIRRGDLDMLSLSLPDGLAAAPATSAPSAAVPLGRWRVSGEICDGKCRAGAMRPGDGLAHKACANLCISGGVPPVLVTAAPVEGRRFLLLADADGGPMPASALDLVALPVTLEGMIERRDDLLVFRVDWSRARPQ